jgi:hypothetical protein
MPQNFPEKHGSCCLSAKCDRQRTHYKHRHQRRPKVPGVLAVITHLKAPKLASPKSGGGDSSGGDAQVTAANAQSGEAAVLGVKILLKSLFRYCNLTKSIFTDSTSVL